MDKYQDLQVDDIFFFTNGIRITWTSPSLGFGEVTLVKHENEDLVIDSESMSPEFVKALFIKVAERTLI